MISARPPIALVIAVALTEGLSACQSAPSDSSPRAGAQTTAPVLQPGSPGEPNVVMTGRSAAPTTQAVDVDDIRFMQEMISHHAQALRIVAVVKTSLTDTQCKAIAIRIEVAQRPEINAMAKWLTTHAQAVPLEASHPLVTPVADHHFMPGMASTAQLKALSLARGPDADRLFLTLMIAHHQGALTMALDQRTHGTDDRATELSDDISVTQTAEIGHMRQMLARLGS